MNKRIAAHFDRAKHYLEQIRASMAKADPVQMMADAAEAGFQLQAIYKECEAILKARKIDGKTVS